MAVVLTSATRQNPLPCQHFIARVDSTDLGKTVFVPITMGDINAPITDDDLVAVLKLWARYQIASGKTLAQLVGGTIFSVIP